MSSAKAMAAKVGQFLATYALEAGDAVMLTSVTAVPNAVPGVSPTRGMPTATKAQRMYQNLFVGIVANDAEAGTYVDVVMQGNCRAKVVTGQSLSVGDSLVVAQTNGTLTERTNEGYNFVAFSCEAVTTTATTYVEVWLPGSVSNQTGEFLNRVDLANDGVYIGTDNYDVTGDNNTFVGRNAGNSNTDGYSNTFVGSSAGNSNTGGDYNTFVGSAAGKLKTGGASNTFVGSGAGYFNTDGGYNTFVGGAAGYSNTGGDNNTFVGNSAGRYLSDGSTKAEGVSDSVAIGRDTEFSATDDENSIVIGYGAEGAGDNTAVLGNTSVAETTLRASLLVTGQKSSDPADPADGSFVIWMSDGTGSGDDGDIMIKSTNGSGTTTGTLYDHT